jgi:hypothetical protein
MARRRIGQDRQVFSSKGAGRQSTLDRLLDLIGRVAVQHQLRDISCVAKGEPAWLPLALFKAIVIAVWHDLSDVRLAEALDDCAEPGREDAGTDLSRPSAAFNGSMPLPLAPWPCSCRATPSLHKTTAPAGRAYRPATKLPIGTEAL